MNGKSHDGASPALTSFLSSPFSFNPSGPAVTSSPLLLGFISSFCLSLTFRGFFALTGPSTLLSFHYPNCQHTYQSTSTYNQHYLPYSSMPPDTDFQHAPGHTKCHFCVESIWQRTRTSRDFAQSVQGLVIVNVEINGRYL